MCSLRRFFRSLLSYILRIEGSIFLACCWILGLLSGALIYFRSGHILAFQMHGFSVEALSVTALLGVIVFPFLLSFILVTISGTNAIVTYAFVKGFLYSFASLFLLYYVELYSWFRWGILFFSHCISGTMLYLLWLRIIRNSQVLIWEGCLLLTLSILAGSVEYCVISPNLVSLIYF